jgi:4-amino-4-deoxy-L-arabinose transferase-like glycosyltransferase
MSDAARPATKPVRWNIVLLQLVFLYLLALKLWFGLAVTPMGDEAYYWMWGQHLSWSYFDHPPLDGWLQGLMAAIFGWSNLSVRLLSWLTLAGTLGIFWLWSARLSPDDRSGWFWHTAVFYLCIPVIFVMSSFAFHDHLLLFLVVAATYVFHGFTGDWEDGRRTWRKLYLAAALLGLAVLTKYNGVFLGLAFAIWVLVRPKLRSLFATPHLYLAALLAILIQAPVFYWNATHGWVSFRFHLGDRAGSGLGQPNLSQVIDYLATMAVLMSPVLFLSLFRLPWLKPKSPDESRAIGLSSSIYLTSTLAWAVIAAYVYVYFHWNVVAYAGLAPIAYRLLGPRVGWLHVAFGLIVVTVGLVSYTLTPTSLFGYRDLGAAASYGWPTLATEVQAVQQANPGTFLAATRYTYAAQLGFELHDADVAAFNQTPSQNDFWWDKAAHKGQDAIIIADQAAQSTIDEARPHFASLQKLSDVPARDAFGDTVWTFEIWLARGYDGN